MKLNPQSHIELLMVARSFQAMEFFLRATFVWFNSIKKKIKPTTFDLDTGDCWRFDPAWFNSTQSARHPDFKFVNRAERQLPVSLLVTEDAAEHNSLLSSRLKPIRKRAKTTNQGNRVGTRKDILVHEVSVWAGFNFFFLLFNEIRCFRKGTFRSFELGKLLLHWKLKGFIVF